MNSEHKHTQNLGFANGEQNLTRDDPFVYCLLFYIYDKRCPLFSFHFSVVLIEWVQAAHLQGQDDPDHQVWNKGYKSKYVV